MVTIHMLIGDWSLHHVTNYFERLNNICYNIIIFYDKLNPHHRGG